MKDEVYKLRHLIRELEHDASRYTDTTDLENATKMRGFDQLEDQDESRNGGGNFTYGLRGSTSAVKELGVTSWRTLAHRPEHTSSCGPMGVYSFQLGEDSGPPPRPSLSSDLRPSRVMASDLTNVSPSVHMKLLTNFHERVNRYHRFIDPVTPFAPLSPDDMLGTQFSKGAILAAGSVFASDTNKPKDWDHSIGRDSECRARCMHAASERRCHPRTDNTFMARDEQRQ